MAAEHLHVHAHVHAPSRRRIRVAALAIPLDMGFSQASLTMLRSAYPKASETAARARASPALAA